MRKINKLIDSNIVTNSYAYPADRVLIITELDSEQENFCAYTEEYFCPGYARDVEHFDPTIKDTDLDGYSNWYSASSRINRHKGSDKRWSEHQPILYPTSEDLEVRLIYNTGHYILANPTDKEADNLRCFLFLNEFGLPEARSAYIKRLQYMLEKWMGNDVTLLSAYLTEFPEQIQYRTAIRTEFGITV